MKALANLFLYIVIFIAISGGLALWISYSLASQSREKFSLETETVKNILQNRIDLYTNAILATQSFFYSSTDVSRKDFANYFKSINLEKNYSGITAVAFTERVLNENKLSFIDSIKKDTSIVAEGYPTFTITPDTSKEEYLVVKYTESATTGSGIPSGSDLTENEARYQTILTARNTGELAATGKVASINPTNAATFFVIYAPLYKNNLPINKQSERIDAFYGVLNFAFATEGLFDKVLTDKNLYKDIQIKIYAGDKNEDSLLWEANKDIVFTRTILENTKQIQVANTVWNVEFKSRLGYGLSDFEYRLPLFALAIGVIISLLLISIFRFLINSRKRAEAIAAKITKELTVSEQKFKSIISGVSMIVFSIDKNGIFTLSDGKGLSALGIRPGEVVGKSVFELYKDNPEIVNDVKKALDGEQFTSISKVGDLVYENHYSPVKIDGKVEGVIGVSVDTTKRYKAEENVKKTSNELERINKTMLNRELKMIELKKEIDNLKQQQNNG